MPSVGWQDSLAARLSTNILEGPHNSSIRQSGFRAFGEAPLPQRRRLDGSSSQAGPSHPDWNEMYTIEASSGDSMILTVSPTQLNVNVSDSEEADESQCITAFGQLSLDENQEVPYASIDAPIYSQNPGQISRESQWSPPPHAK